MTTRQLRTTLSAGVIALAALSGVAHADTGGEIAKYDAKTSRYCISRMVIGSMIPQRTCETKQGWIDRGATVAAARSRTQLAAK